MCVEQGVCGARGVWMCVEQGVCGVKSVEQGVCVVCGARSVWSEECVWSKECVEQGVLLRKHYL